MPTTTLIRGRVLAPDPVEHRFVLHDDALVSIDPRGRIVGVSPAPVGCITPETWPGAVVIPGLVDTHLHYPQTRVIGSASGPLLPWLEASVFPEEGRFSSSEYAAAVADEFCRSMIAQGTTCAGIYSSSHAGATEVLFAALDRAGLRASAGMTLMDRGAPADLLVDADAALPALAELVERWHGHDEGRLLLSVVPRFALSCSSELMSRAAAFAQAHDLLIQTHISENLDEIQATRAMFPGSADYLGVYEDHGLTGPKTVLGHCIHLSESEWERVAASNTVVSHCPDSNFFLGSGCMPLRAALDRGVRVGLGTDVGAGRTFSMRRVVAGAYDASLLVGAPVLAPELLWLATRGGAMALGRGESTGCIAAGYEADLAVVDAPDLELGPLIDALCFRHDAGPVRATLVRGRRLSSS